MHLWEYIEQSVPQSSAKFVVCATLGLDKVSRENLIERVARALSLAYYKHVVHHCIYLIRYFEWATSTNLYERKKEATKAAAQPVLAPLTKTSPSAGAVINQAVVATLRKCEPLHRREELQPGCNHYVQ